MMLDRLLAQRKAVTLALAETTEPNTPANLSAHEWTTAEDLVKTLKPFVDVTVLMSSARYPTLSTILSVLDGLKDYLQNTNDGLDGLRKILEDQITVKFGDFANDEELCVATLVYPRFKAILFTDDRRGQVIE